MQKLRRVISYLHDLSELSIIYRLDGPLSDYKSVGVLPRSIAQNSRKFEPAPQNSNRRFTEENFARGKGKSHQNFESRSRRFLCGPTTY